MSEQTPTISVSYGITVNLGNYESEKISCSLTLPLEDVFEVQFDMMFRQVKMKVLEKGGKFGSENQSETLMTKEIEKKEPVKRPNAPKIVLGVVYKIAAKKCDKCKGLISWDDFDANTHRWPTHVNESGQIIGDGSCPEATF